MIFFEFGSKYPKEANRILTFFFILALVSIIIGLFFPGFINNKKGVPEVNKEQKMDSSIKR
jgi:hypothetical protein